MIVSITQALSKLSPLLPMATEEPVVITRHGKPVGVLISPTEFAKLRKLRACLEMLQLAEELRSSGATAQELHRLSCAKLEARHQ